MGRPKKAGAIHTSGKTASVRKSKNSPLNRKKSAANAATVKRGPMSQDEKDHIARNYVDDTPETLAAFLRRNPKTIRNYLNQMGWTEISRKDAVDEFAEERIYLHSLGWWAAVLEQFCQKEVIFFEQMWGKLYNQFDNDVLPSEEIQIRKFITLEIMKDRALIKIQQQTESYDVLEQSYREELAVDRADRDRDMMRELKEEVSAIKSSIPSLNGEYRDLCKEQTVVEKGLSASRNDRIKNIQDASKNWSSVLKSLEDPKTRKEVGRYMEVMRAARDKEMIRLTSLHKFVDGDFDRPMLSGRLEKFYDIHEAVEKQLNGEDSDE